MAQQVGELWDRMFSWANLMKALERVERNKGAAGVDGMSVGELVAEPLLVQNMGNRAERNDCRPCLRLRIQQPLL